MVVRDGAWAEVTPGERFRIQVSAASTNGGYTVIEVETEPGNGVSMHLHRHEEEHFIVIGGEGRFARGDEIVDLSTGQSMTVPRGVPHAFTNHSTSTLRMLVIFSPGHLEAFFRATLHASTEELIALGTQLGSEIVGPPMKETRYSLRSPRPSPGR